MMRVFAIVALALVAPHAALEVRNTSTPVLKKSAKEALSFMQVELGPFDSVASACEYCDTSFTKKGDPPAGPVAPYCICMSYPSDGGHMMFCATPPSAAKYVADKSGCRCNVGDMQAMGQTTCEPIG
eukprot:gnl/TRDRNA2_/TRDRNA2_177647_c0_seq1.p1 gnl/TRDRNA2_/TRDRNA2_177647_c0~~gnl/TRDRNA2_/TRDRNA2_177647_c0_seq1.p1  ORF type:complete len:127 (+),score=25.68 gnl/TRDRNA2_/TRDRNA2_177647_c0_seq1:71-451(+)